MQASVILTLIISAPPDRNSGNPVNTSLNVRSVLVPENKQQKKPSDRGMDIISRFSPFVNTFLKNILIFKKSDYNEGQNLSDEDIKEVRENGLPVEFYEGKSSMGILYLCTVGLFGIGWFVDIIVLLCKPNPYYV